MRNPMRGLIGLMLALTTLAGCAKTAEQPVAPVAAPAAPLAVSGALTVVELAPVLMTMQALYPDQAIKMGGVASLYWNPPADIATNAETQALRVSVKNPDVRIIMTVAEGLYRVVARKSAGINSIADLKGKRVATWKLASSGYFLEKMLRTAGLTIEDVTVVELNPLGKMVEAIDRKEVDAIAIWEPHSENAARVLGADAIEFSGRGIYRELFNLNTTAGALNDPVKRASIVRFVRGIIDATAALNRDPSAAQAAMAKSGNFTLEEVQNSWKHHAYVANFAEDMLDVLVEEDVWLAKHEGRAARSREELSRLIDTSVYREALRL
ncbi:ABC transporter substrate-binding protein [Sphingomonas soli]|uniref:ABC transporter substrate-binding protein n=1 Tax=Sphingomonas soli TaxID=266127 RepID=UPI000A014681|nr:ABC transporter substrate-binding protein [Sphingomonas soli]